MVMGEVKEPGTRRALSQGRGAWGLPRAEQRRPRQALAENACDAAAPMPQVASTAFPFGACLTFQTRIK